MKWMNKKALVTGSFDPPTIGHIALIEKAAAVFDEVVVCVFRNSEKKYLFSETERAKMLSVAIEEYGLLNVTVDVSGGYVADYTRENGISFVVRGVRDAKDMAYETEMARYNHNLNPNMETLLWVAHEDKKGISSTEARKSIQQGDWDEDILPKSVLELIKS